MVATHLGEDAFETAGPGFPRLDGGLVELPLLLPLAQVALLERQARQRGLTLGQMLRRLIRDWTSRESGWETDTDLF
jgi:hypothetical protein